MALPPFSAGSIQSNGPAIGAFAITPANADLPRPCRALTVGTAAGVVVYRGWDGITYTTASLPVGTYPICFDRILPATTATGLTGWV